jgi:hypothetical protein
MNRHYTFCLLHPECEFRRRLSELYSHLFEEMELRLAESAQVGVGFDIPAYIAPNCSKEFVTSDVQVNT